MPQNAAAAAPLSWRSADVMWRMAGDTATDYNHYTKRAILSAVYGSTLLAWLQDDSEGAAETAAFPRSPDRRGDAVRKVEGRPRQGRAPEPHPLPRPPPLPAALSRSVPQALGKRPLDPRCLLLIISRSNDRPATPADFALALDQLAAGAARANLRRSIGTLLGTHEAAGCATSALIPTWWSSRSMPDRSGATRWP
jgi:hypothetical protein